MNEIKETIDELVRLELIMHGYETEKFMVLSMYIYGGGYIILGEAVCDEPYNIFFVLGFKAKSEQIYLFECDSDFKVIKPIFNKAVVEKLKS